MARLDETISAGQAGHISDSQVLARKANYVYDVMDYGAVGDGVTDDSTEIQAAIDAAEAVSPRGTVFFPSLNFKIDTGITILDCDVESLRGSLLTVAAGVAAAVTVGADGSSCDWRRISLPAITRVSRDWDSTPTINTARGVVIAAADSCVFEFGTITDFSYGLVVEGDSEGVAYNTLLLPTFVNNAINLYINAINTGWSNQNTFIGGNQIHSNIGGTPPYTGVMNTQIAAGNGNTFVGTSLEGGYEEFLLDCDGTDNIWLGCRWEASGTSRVRWGATSTRNRIDGGYDASSIVSTVTSGGRDNSILGTGSWLFDGRPLVASTPVVGIQNPSSNIYGLMIYPLGSPLVTRNLTTEYGVRLGSLTSGYKAEADTEERIYFNHATGRLHFGDGSIDPATLGALRFFGGTRWELSGVDLRINPDNTHDLGEPTQRFKDAYFGGKVKLNAAGEIHSGSGTPESAITAPIGSLFMRSDGGTGTALYVKELGTGSTGWVAK